MDAVLWTEETKMGGKVSITPRPRGGRQLVDEMAALRAAGVDILVSALAAGENEEFGLGLGDEVRTAEEAGLSFRSVPIEDMSTPTDSDKTLVTLDELAAEVRAGKHVAVHCFGSIGRSGMISTLLLCRNGWEPEAAMARMSELRGRRVPETDEQRQWVLQHGATAGRGES
jgi:protein-tyrosine phosphatase